MIKEKWENIKALIVSKKDDKSKQNIQNLIVFLIILIITIIAVNTIWNEDNTKKDVNYANNNIKLADKMDTEKQVIEQNNLEQRLENILERIEGVGEAKVLITYSETSTTVAMFNENKKETSTEEADSGGGTRTITEVDTNKEMVYKEENGEKTPITEKTIMPKIEGAIITAEGAGKAEIRANIIQAVEAATGLATHKIQVFAMQM